MRKLAVAALVLALSAAPLGRASQAPPAADLGVLAPAGVVVSATAVSSDIGAEILSKGGNAVDAAVATAFALAVTYPFAGNIGGGGFMVVRTPDGKATTFDYREKAPLKSTPTMYLNEKGEMHGAGASTIRQAALARRRDARS
jgi:gamma-glutamyltranspeptidase/glutathione hydrolase